MKTVSSMEAWTGTADCRNCAIRQSVLFSRLDETDFDAIHRQIDQYSFPPGSVIYSQDDTANAIFTIRSGLVKLTHYLPDGTQRIVRLLQATDVIGLEALTLSRYEHAASALHPTEICRIPAEVVRELLQRKPQLFNELMARWQRAVSDCDRVITELSTGPARSRVVHLLLWLTEHRGRDRCDLFSREDLGALLGLTTETVSRTMAELKRQGCISEPRLNAIVCNADKLRSQLG